MQSNSFLNNLFSNTLNSLQSFPYGYAACKSIGINAVYIIPYAFNRKRKLKDSLLNTMFVERMGYI
jgi:hypothetical protein